MLTDKKSAHVRVPIDQHHFLRSHGKPARTLQSLIDEFMASDEVRSEIAWKLLFSPHQPEPTETKAIAVGLPYLEILRRTIAPGLTSRLCRTLIERYADRLSVGEMVPEPRPNQSKKRKAQSRRQAAPSELDVKSA